MECLSVRGRLGFLRDKLVLKGATARDLFYPDIALVFVDIDLNHIRQLDREESRKACRSVQVQSSFRWRSWRRWAWSTDWRRPLGHNTSTRSTTVARPNPKWSGVACCER